MKQGYMKPVMQVVKMQQQSSMLLPGSGSSTNRVKSVSSNADFTFSEEGSDGDARIKRRSLWDE